MKLQGMGIIFAIVILPIAVILSYYIQMQVDTINLQTSYDAKIIDATHDAMAALELNTANENMSTVSDSLRSILEASNSIFFNTLLTDFGLSNGKNSLLEPYVPAILYTLYDGYYIYSQTNTPTVLKYRYDPDRAETYSSDGEFYYIGDDKKDLAGQPVYTDTNELKYLTETGGYTPDVFAEGVKEKNAYMLKSYMPYSARYTWNSENDVTINYTLDNYMNIAGTIDGVYYTKTGYLINPDSVELDNSSIRKIDNDFNYTQSIAGFDYDIYNEQDVENLIASGEYSNISINVILPTRNKDGDITSQTGGGTAKFLVDYAEYRKELSGELIDPGANIWSTDCFFNEESNGKPNTYNSGVKIVHDIDHESLESLQELERLALDHYQVARSEQENLVPDSDLSYDPDSCIQLLRIVKPKIQMIQAVQYYIRNRIFSNWVYSYLKDIKESDIDEAISDSEKKIFQEADAYLQQKNEDYVTIFKDFKNSDNKIFGDKHQDTEVESIFINHKCTVIRNSIQHNLNLAFTIHTKKSNGMLFEVPIMSDAEWDKITRYISIVSYFGGMPCGSKTYSNYALISSTNNEMTAIPEELYYVKSNKFNDRQTESHRIDCEKYIDDLKNYDDADDNSNSLKYKTITIKVDEDGNPDTERTESNIVSSVTDPIKEPTLISFRSKDIKYDRIYNKTSGKYEYDFQNLTCYDCIVNNNARFTKNQERGLSVIDYNLLQSLVSTGTDSQKMLYREYAIGIACQRQGLYKTNAFTKSEGYETQLTNENTLVFDVGASDVIRPGFTARKNYEDLKAIEIVIDNFHSSSNMETVVPITVSLGDVEVGVQTLILNKYSKNQTIRIDIDPLLLKGKTPGSIVVKLHRDTTTTKIEGKYRGVRLIYK